MTEAQITEALHIFLILVIAISSYLSYLVHKKNGEQNAKLDQVIDNQAQVKAALEDTTKL